VADDTGIWSGVVAAIGAGARYRFRLDDRWAFPDPYSRSQPDGPHGASEVVDPGAFAWHDGAWAGLDAQGLVIYELHVGGYTREGTFDALIAELDALATLGVTAIELMPVAEAPGARGWGYDAVNLFAPSRNYGGPDGLRRLVDAAHAGGLGIILDVVYNHFGPDGNYLAQYASDYFTDRHKTPWGDAINFDGPNSHMVRRLFTDNVRRWIEEYHIDGFRLDATYTMIDESARHILADLSVAARAAAAPRSVILCAETYENDVRYVGAVEDGGFGFDGVWADDFHHVSHVLVTGERQGYYAAYAGSVEELARTINRGWLFEDRRSSPPPARGTVATGVAARSFVYALQNHDQAGNRAFGERLSQPIAIDEYRALSALQLLLPYTPLLFMGQEFAASTPFLYFTDHHAELGRLVTEGRRREFADLPALADPEQRERIPDPQSLQTFLDSKLDLTERTRGAGRDIYALYRELLSLRRTDPVLRSQDRERMRAHAVYRDVLLVHSWHGQAQRLVAVNFGDGIESSATALGAPGDVSGRTWLVRLSTDERRFGGSGRDARFSAEDIRIPGRTALWLASEEPS
jgi:maltooligosyltrehalose trehalohydrolase